MHATNLTVEDWRGVPIVQHTACQYIQSCPVPMTDPYTAGLLLGT